MLKTRNARNHCFIAGTSVKICNFAVKLYEDFFRQFFSSCLLWSKQNKREMYTKIRPTQLRSMLGKVHSFPFVEHFSTEW